MRRQEKLFSADSEMKTEHYKRIKFHIHRMTAVICSGLLVFASGVCCQGVSVQAADKSGRGTLLRVQPRKTKKQDYQLKDYANELKRREDTYKISVDQAEELLQGSEESVSVRGDWIASKEQMRALKKELKSLLKDADGMWSIYVKDLQSRVSFSINNKEMYAASLIKLFVMEKCFADYQEIIANDMKTTGGKKDSTDDVETLLEGMIEVSDNGYFNELVKLQNEDGDFKAGAEEINGYLETQGYTDTGVYHTLHPSDSEYEWNSDERNHTSVEDCGFLLERIYDGDCVSEEASAKMMEFLLNQQLTEKIPAGVPEKGDAMCANKTGETDSDHHDAAIVFGSKKDYVLCIMSSEWEDSSEAVMTIQEISRTVYEMLNK